MNESSLEARVANLAREQMQLQGYVRWQDIVKASGVSHQAVSACKARMVSRNFCTAEELTTWNNAYTKTTVRAETRLTKRNLQMLKDRAAVLDISWHDVLNRALHQTSLDHHAKDHHP